MGSFFFYHTVFDNHDPVGVFDGRESVGDHDRRAAFSQLLEALLDVVFGYGIQG